MKRLITFVLFTILLFSSNKLFAVNFADAARAPQGFYLVNYFIGYVSDEYTDSEGEDITNGEMDFSLYSWLIRPVYYYGDFAANVIIPIGKKESGLFEEDDSGIGDISIMGAYWLPVKIADMCLVVGVKLPTGPFDKDKDVNYGDGQADIYLEYGLNKFTLGGKLCIDVAVRYWIRLENSDTEEKPGNEFRAELLVSYSPVTNFYIGPQIIYMLGQDMEADGETVSDSATKFTQVGGAISYLFTKDIAAILEVLQDVQSENYLKGTFVNMIVSYAF